MGNAIRNAAADIFEKIKAMKREVGEPEGSNISLPDLLEKRFGVRAGNIVGSGSYKPDYTSPSVEDGRSQKATPFWAVAGTGAEIEVDTETGHVRVSRLVSVIDSGKAINPKIVEGQISGAALMHLGFTLFEDIHIEGGQITNGSLADYKIPSFHDMPSGMENVFIETLQTNGPFGAKGVGESASFCVSPAVANALEDAIGIRLTQLPLTPEAVLRAIQEKAGQPLEDS
jgi:CO/xanthine dehydrogenase Mo-binding subunit